MRAKSVKFVRKNRPDFKDPTDFQVHCALLDALRGRLHKSTAIDTIEQSGRVKIQGYIKRTAVPMRDTVVPAAPEEVPSDQMN